MPRFRSTTADESARGLRRVQIVGAFFALFFGVLACRAVSFHLKNNEELQKVALRQYRTAVRENSMRGKILDAQGRDMAIGVMSDSVFANPGEIKNAVDAAASLSAALGVDRKLLLDRLSSKRKFVWIKRWVSREELERVEAMGIDGVYSMKEARRSYPNGTVGASLLGAVGFDGEPLGGLELHYDDVLSSRSRSDDLKRDARGHLYLSPGRGEEDAQRRNIKLTIDKTLQFMVDEELERGVRSARAQGGEAIVVDVRTGAVLAMASQPTFDPNRYSEYPLANWRNSAIVNFHEPGSTFKVVVVAAALDSGAASEDDIFDCERGRVRIGRNEIRDVRPHGKLTLADIVKVSSNIGAYKISQQLGRVATYEAIKRFGFGRRTGIDLPGEAAGILSAPDKWSEVQFATIAFGQGVAATSLQMTMAFAAIANGGNLMRPYVVKEVISEEGDLISRTEPSVVSRPIGPKTAAVMARLMERVVKEEGTGVLAASLDYRVAGKTGTAQKVDARSRGYAKGRYFASFVGFAPVDDPRIAVFVGIDEPKGEYYGGQIAAPVFRRVTEKTLRYLKVPASPRAHDTVTASVQLPGLPYMDDSPQVLSEEGALRQVTRHDDKSWSLPDFRGMTMRGVLAAAGDAEIDWRFHGSGIAVRQWPEPGSVLRDGDLCRVEFKSLL